VEDDDALREAISFTLGVHDISHCLASNGIEALAWLNIETPAIIVSDVRMPELDGIGLLRAVRRQMPEVPFVLMTAYADVAAAVDAIKSGAREFLLKPFQPETLIEVVERHRADPTASGPVGEDPAFLQMLTRLRRVAASEHGVHSQQADIALRPFHWQRQAKNAAPVLHHQHDMAQIQAFDELQQHLAVECKLVRALFFGLVAFAKAGHIRRHHAVARL
jgi:FixJ family two-component response regulator